MTDVPENSTPKRVSLAEELCEVWQKLPDKPMFFGLLAVWLGLFHFLGNATFGYVRTASLPGWLYNAYSVADSDDAHGLLIPIVVLVLFWWKRRELLALEARSWWPGLGFIVTGLLLHVLGYVVQQPRISTVAMFTGIYGLIGLTWGPRWLRASFFPFVLFVFCVPIGSLGESVTFALRMVVTKISVWFSHNFLSIDVIRDGSRIFNSKLTFQYDVAPACSGIRSLISLLALTTIYGFVRFRTGWKRGLLVAVAFPLAVIGNVVRITAVIIAAEAFGQNAGSLVHDYAGFVTFAIALACVFLLEILLGEDRRKPATGGAPT